MVGDIIEFMEIGESQKPKFLEIDAPERLAVGQNFFDQEPFSKILAKQSEATGIDLPRLRYGIVRFAREADSYKLDRGQFEQKIRHPDPNDLENLKADASFYFKVKRSILEHYIESMRKTIMGLSDVPLWADYIIEQMDDQTYKVGGDFAPRTKVVIGTPESYGSWVTRKYTTAQRQLLLGIDEVFPKDMSNETQTPNVGQNKKPGTKRWRILAASEFTHPR